MRKPWFNRSVILIAALAVIISVLTSCSSDHAPTSSSTNSTKVGADGFSIVQGDVAVSAGADVAPVGTTVSVANADQSLPQDVASMVVTLAGPVRVQLGDGAVQPTSPVTLAFKLNGTEAQKQLDAGNVPVLLLQSEGSESVDVIDAKWDAATTALTARAPHLSFAWPGFFNPGAFINEVKDAMSRTLGLSFPKPDCLGKSADFSHTSYHISAITNDVAWPCIRMTPQAQEGTLGIDLYSNTPYLWKVVATPAPIETSQQPTDIETYPAAALYKQIADNDGDPDTILMPGQSVALDFGQYELSPQSGTLTYDVGTYMIGLVGYGISTTLGKFSPGKYQRLLEDRAAIQCLAEMSSSINGPQPEMNGARLGELVKDVIGCTGAVGGSIFNVLTGALGGAVMGPLVSLVSPRLAAQSASFTVTSTNDQNGGSGDSNSSATGQLSNTEVSEEGVRRCGTITIPQTGKAGTVVNDTSAITCDEAMSVMNRYLNDPAVNDRTYTFDEWTCSVLGAAEADQYGHVVECRSSQRPAAVMLGK
ncbi:hypothetical protein [Rhodococcus opacus]|uniref:hypothetical protein n=1 Tax=Rhodococcus opacus TaxID=37919 RepID=UPI001F57B387|nr:hypothetical protein [Rhodococcus opacus]UNN05166.1 hypothetical protein MOO23_40355 [Rhodococcus opacus]